MSTQFSIESCTPPVRGVAVAPYHPYWQDMAAKIKNPKFDRHSGLILDLKKKENRNYAAAVKYATAQIVGLLKRGTFDRAEIVVIPSRTKGEVSPGLDEVVREVCKADKRLTYARNALVRTKTIEKLATGGDRCIDVHLNSMAYRPVHGSPALKIIIDDVMTTGNSIGAAITLMQQHLRGVQYLPLVLGQTVHD